MEMSSDDKAKYALVEQFMAKDFQIPKNPSVTTGGENQVSADGGRYSTAVTSSEEKVATIGSVEALAGASGEKRLGTLSPIDQVLCPALVTSKYPHELFPLEMADTIIEDVSAIGNFWLRSWDVYYVWPPVSVTPTPILLLPAEQVEQHLTETYASLSERDKYDFTLNDEAWKLGLAVRFPQHPDLRPRYLGQCKSRAAFAKMSNRVPNEHYRPISEPKPEISVDAVMRDMYKHIMEQIIAIGRKQTKKVDKTPKRLRQEEKKRQWKHDLRLAERFLGLRPGKIVLEEPGEDASWDDLQAYHAAKDSHRMLEPVDPNRLAPHGFEDRPVFVCIDVECYERDKRKITEVGVATLDTEHLKDLAPGKNGRNWHEKVHARHFRIRDNLHLFNGHYVTDASDKFQFPEGGSELINLEDVAAAITSCFHPPYCDIDRPWLHLTSNEPETDLSTANSDAKAGTNDSDFEKLDTGFDVATAEPLIKVPAGLGLRENASSEGKAVKKGHPLLESENSSDPLQTQKSTLSENPKRPQKKAGSGRRIVLVGHDLASDIRYFSHINIDLESLAANSKSGFNQEPGPATSPTEATILDTTCIYRAWTREWDAKALGSLLQIFELTGWFPHNAGNDAVHTMWIMISMVLQSAVERGDGDVKRQREERQKEKEFQAAVRAGIQAREAVEGWESEFEGV